MERIDAARNDVVYNALKRMADIFLSFSAIVFLSPFFLILAILIKHESDGPAIFCQNRVGLNGKIFKMYKFRSMVNNAEKLKTNLISKNEMDGPMFKIKDDPRVTKIGRFIRKTSIDELPQLINVLKGDMSLVGPRPSLEEEVQKFDDWMTERLIVKPGLTCFWQVSGRNDINFYDWMRLDIEYVRERNIWLDIKLILKTVFVLFGDRHAS